MELKRRKTTVKPGFRIAGCFWHNHSGCVHGRLPTSNREFWESKIARTKDRDIRNAAKLEAAGWRVITVWECELGDECALANRLDSELKGTSSQKPTLS
jgi:DNA mismatch endonuclease (patch repair protein)